MPIRGRHATSSFGKCKLIAHIAHLGDGEQEIWSSIDQVGLGKFETNTTATFVSSHSYGLMNDTTCLCGAFIKAHQGQGF